MLYYLLENVVAIEANEIKELYTDVFPMKFPDNTEQTTVETDAQHTMDEIIELCKDIFCYMHPCIQPCTEINIQAGFSIYQITEEEYNQLYIEEEE